ncbi:hypothetical protein [Rhodovibrio salinarum]|uniref:Uncharacterized protein n=1 Tax=Rhodovibrio salinarum TaxID=1087 RepID=A0A934QM25_9PROT|nr:hypothetical protein [Rhodovibrio salinarum]MBK1699005.1 hypothetical protein [Rhodovibrio salinarum]
MGEAKRRKRYREQMGLESSDADQAQGGSDGKKKVVDAYDRPEVPRSQWPADIKQAVDNIAPMVDDVRIVENPDGSLAVLTA